MAWMPGTGGGSKHVGKLEYYFTMSNWECNKCHDACDPATKIESEPCTATTDRVCVDKPTPGPCSNWGTDGNGNMVCKDGDN